MGETALDASRWRDRVALIARGSSAIGRAVVAARIGAGTRLAACARRSERMDAARAEPGSAADARLHHESEAAAGTIHDRYPALQPHDVSSAVLYVPAQPAHVQIHDIAMRPTAQAS